MLTTSALQMTLLALIMALCFSAIPVRAAHKGNTTTPTKLMAKRRSVSSAKDVRGVQVRSPIIMKLDRPTLPKLPTYRELVDGVDDARTDFRTPFKNAASKSSGERTSDQKTDGKTSPTKDDETVVHIRPPFDPLGLYKKPSGD